MSKTGKKPSKRRKQNQDCFTVIDTYLNMENQMFLGVFDGHGPNGGLVSRYCREHLPKNYNVLYQMMVVLNYVKKRKN